MKTHTRSILSVVGALAVSALLPIAVNAGGNGAKGGAAGLMRKPTAVPHTEVATMNCPKCKNDYVVKKDWTDRGANKTDKVVAKHLCDTCNTELKTVGVGKRAVNVATHTCAACKN